jgi:hypothetical protein
MSAGPGQFGRDYPAYPSGTTGDEGDTATQVDVDVGGARAAIRGACRAATGPTRLGTVHPGNHLSIAGKVVRIIDDTSQIG